MSRVNTQEIYPQEYQGSEEAGWENFAGYEGFETELMIEESDAYLAPRETGDEGNGIAEIEIPSESFQEGSAASESAQVLYEIQKVGDKAQEALDKKIISQKIFDDAFDLLNRAKSMAELTGNDDEQLYTAMMLVTDAQEKLMTASAQPIKAQALADHLGISAEDVTSAAQGNGVDLENLEANSNLMKMLRQLGVPKEDKISEYKRLKEDREKDMEALRMDLETQVIDWRHNSQNSPNSGQYEKSFKYFKKEDDQYKNMQSAIEEMQKDLLEALNALGLIASAGAASDKLVVSGISYDFFTEDNASFTLSSMETTLTQKEAQFAKAYNNTEADQSSFPFDQYNWYRKNAPEGYPGDKFTQD